jgi:hypothetical protein
MTVLKKDFGSHNIQQEKKEAVLIFETGRYLGRMWFDFGCLSQNRSQ